MSTSKAQSEIDNTSQNTSSLFYSHHMPMGNSQAYIKNDNLNFPSFISQFQSKEEYSEQQDQALRPIVREASSHYQMILDNSCGCNCHQHLEFVQKVKLQSKLESLEKQIGFIKKSNQYLFEEIKVLFSHYQEALKLNLRNLQCFVEKSVNKMVHNTEKLQAEIDQISHQNEDFQRQINELQTVVSKQEKYISVLIQENYELKIDKKKNLSSQSQDLKSSNKTVQMNIESPVKKKGSHQRTFSDLIENSSKPQKLESSSSILISDIRRSKQDKGKVNKTALQINDIKNRIEKLKVNILNLPEQQQKS